MKLKKGLILIEMLKYVLQTLDLELDPDLELDLDPNTTQSLDPDSDPNSTNLDPKHCYF